MTSTRRELLKTIPAAALAAAGATRALAIPPLARSGKARLRLGLAGYSLRDHLTGKLSPAMTLDDFIERAAAWEVDAVEPTSYYFPPDFTRAYVAGLKRHCHLLGIDVSTTPIRNTFTYPGGPEREREIAHVKRWLNRRPTSAPPRFASSLATRRRASGRRRLGGIASSASKPAPTMPRSAASSWLSRTTAGWWPSPTACWRSSVA
jgi:hypothetical protein